MPATEPRHPPPVIGWDVGGAHVKACRLARGRVVDVAEWACPLWQGLAHLERVLRQAAQRWPGLREADHAVTMTGEMTDRFEDREQGVNRIAATMAAGFGRGHPGARPNLHFYGGDAGWLSAAQAAEHWRQIGSANWLATATHAAAAVDGDGLLIDIGSTTTDLIPIRRGRVLTAGRSDADRLAEGELVYHGVVRTPLCALGPKIDWQGRPLNVMNEWFATSADVYRTTGELDAAHDLHPSADDAAKDAPATHRRLARMIGLDGRDADAAAWRRLAEAWRTRQVAVIAAELRRVVERHGLRAEGGVAIVCGCGDFLAADVLAAAAAGSGGAFGSRPFGHRPFGHRRYADVVAALEPIGAADASIDAPGLAAWVQVGGPAVAVASLFSAQRDRRAG